MTDHKILTLMRSLINVYPDQCTIQWTPGEGTLQLSTPLCVLAVAQIGTSDVMSIMQHLTYEQLPEVNRD